MDSSTLYNYLTWHFSLVFTFSFFTVPFLLWYTSGCSRFLCFLYVKNCVLPFSAVCFRDAEQVYRDCKSDFLCFPCVKAIKAIKCLGYIKQFRVKSQNELRVKNGLRVKSGLRVKGRFECQLQIRVNFGSCSCRPVSRRVMLVLGFSNPFVSRVGLVSGYFLQFWPSTRH